MKIVSSKIENNVIEEYTEDYIDSLDDKIRIKIVEDYNNRLKKSIDDYINAEETKLE